MKNISLSDRKLFLEYLSRYPVQTHELNFTNLFVWKDYKKHEFELIDDHIVVSSKDGLYPPLGPNPDKIIMNILEERPKSIFIRVGKTIAQKLKKNLDIKEDPDNFDYVYDIKEIIKLEGGKYARERNFVNKFSKLDTEICPLNKNNIDEFHDLLCEWCKKRDCKADGFLLAEAKANHIALDNFKELDLFGICIRLDKKIAGYAIGDKLNESTFLEHFEKAEAAKPGAYQFLLKAFAQNIPNTFSFINREQDLGLEGLKKAKQAWNPVKMVEKFIIKN